MITITEAYVAGLTQENAKTLIDRAHDLGLPASVVRTVDGGFIVPAVVAQEPAPAPVPAPVMPTLKPVKRSYTRKTTSKYQSAKNTTADAVASEE